MIVSVGRMMRKGGGGLIWPKGLKESIKAIYDPAKQGMTNYDVIESYVTDFTTWRTADKNYVGLTIRSSSFSISFNKVSNHVIMWKPNYLFNEEGQVKLQVSGITNNISIIIKHGTQEFPIVNGVNTFSFTQEENKSLSFVCKNVFQDTNITITQLPTSILKDLSGNGNHAYLYGGKGKLNSGIGLYTYDYNSDRWSSTGRADYIITKKGFEFTNIIEDGGIIFALGSNIAKEGDKVKVKISGIPNGGRVYFGTWITATEDGEYLGTYAYDNNGNTTIGTLGCIGATITLEFIPDYPDQLCYDGKMYAVAYDMPILTDYTVMAERTWFKIGDNSCFASKRIGANKGAFAIEYRKLYAENFGSYNAITFVANKKEIIVQSKEKYNDKDLIAGNEIDTNQLLIGGISLNNNRLNEPYIGCHGTIIVADRSFTEEEINWLKDNLFRK